MPFFNEAGFGSGRFGIPDNGETALYTLGVGYYLGLITSQYQLSTNFLLQIRESIEKLEDLAYALEGFEFDFDPDFAIGVQLDTVGALVGANRTLPFTPSGGLSPVLDDVTYRRLIRATIQRNTWDGTTPTILTNWQKLYPGGRLTLVDNENMSATVVASGGLTSLDKDMLANDMILPRPEGVLYGYIFSALPIFGFSETNTAIIAGFDLGKFS